MISEVSSTEIGNSSLSIISIVSVQPLCVSFASRTPSNEWLERGVVQQQGVVSPLVSPY